jgi:ectoine hydroxylase
MSTRPSAAHLSPEQRQFFETNGYLIIEGALDGAQIARLTGIVDRLDEVERRETKLSPQAFMEIRNAIAREPALLELIDWPTAFPLVAELMGPDLQLNTSHVMVRPPQPPETAASFKAIDWHRDGCEQVYAVQGTYPWIYTKIGYFLTDLSRPGMGNLRVVPGSHLRAERPTRSHDNIDPDGAIEVLTRPGDSVLFQQRTWHAVGPNYASISRKNIYMGYCYRWVKPLDYVAQSPALIERATPLQRQLLGECRSDMTFWLPKEGEVPLREWLKEHVAHGEPVLA